MDGWMDEHQQIASGYIYSKGWAARHESIKLSLIIWYIKYPYSLPLLKKGVLD